MEILEYILGNNQILGKYIRNSFAKSKEITKIRPTSGQNEKQNLEYPNLKQFINISCFSKQEPFMYDVNFSRLESVEF